MRRTLFICIFLTAAPLAAYWQVQNYDFILFDDPDYVTQNPYVMQGLSLEGLQWAFTQAHAGNWHPLTWLSLMLDSHVFGLDAGGYHLTNLLLHVVNVLLLFGLLKRMTGGLWRSAFVAAVFAIHPLHVESVAWVTERKDVLSLFFGLLTIWAYVGYARHGGIGRYLLVAILLALGLMAKQMLVTWPFVLLLLDYWPLRRMQVNGSHTDPKASHSSSIRSSPPIKLVLEKIPLFGIVAAAVVIVIFAQQSDKAIVDTAGLPMSARLGNALVSYVDYLGKMIWPRNLSVFYPHPALIGDGLWWWQVAGCAVLLAIITVVAYRLRRTRPYFLVGWLWYLGTLVPAIGLMQVGRQAMADRYTYIPLMGIYIILAWTAADLTAGWRSRKYILSITSAVVFSACLAGTWVQVGYWKNSQTLFTHALAVDWNNPLAHNSLGVVFLNQGKIDKATHHFQEAVRINPRHVSAQLNLANVLLSQKQPDQAIVHYKRTVELWPERIDARYSLATLLAIQGRYNQAIEHFRILLQTNPDHPGALNGLAWLLATSPDEGVRDGPMAVTLAERACRITTDSDTNFLDTLAAAYAEAGRFPEAITTARQASEVSTADTNKELDVALNLRLKLYEARQPYRQSNMPGNREGRKETF
jgi:protein O-mannosyl-transferase